MENIESMIIKMDAFVRSIGINRSTPHALFLGAGASVSSGVPSAQVCIWEWKRSIFLTNNPGLEKQFSELSLPSIQQRIQKWLDQQGGYPPANSPLEYGFYIEHCFPIAADRRAYFQEKVRNAESHVGYRLICHLAEAGLVRSVWTTNFDGLTARAAANFKITPIEVGIDSQDRIIRPTSFGELLSVSLHGDYRYDNLKNTSEELQKQDAMLRKALINEIINTPLIVCGYSGRDESIMEALSEAYGQKGSGALYWCDCSDQGVPEHVAMLIKHAQKNGRQAYYAQIVSFDDLLTRIALHCLDEEKQDAIRAETSAISSQKALNRTPFQVEKSSGNVYIKSNAFELDCPSEVLTFDLKIWPKTKVWSSIRQIISEKQIVAVPFRGKVLALGTIDDIKSVFGDNIKGPIERTPVGPNELRYDDSAVVSLMRSALVRSLAEVAGVNSNLKNELWCKTAAKTVFQDETQCYVHESLHVFIRQIGSTQYIILKPSVRVLDDKGNDIPIDIANPVKLGILGYQHNKPFNHAINKWRNLLFKDGKKTIVEFPRNCASSFKFNVWRAPAFAKIGVLRGRPISISIKMRPLLKHHGFQLNEPQLVFSSKGGSGTVKDTHPIRGVLKNRPYDYPLTSTGLSSSLRIGVVCPKAETELLRAYLQKVRMPQQATSSERDYLLDYPGFFEAYGLPLELPEPDASSWVSCPEPSNNDLPKESIEVANKICMCIEALHATYATQLVLIFFPKRWAHLRGYKDENENFDVHDFVKAFCVQRGVSSQFLEQDTLSNAYQCRVWWWLSLAFYVKAMRTPWVLETLDEDTTYVGIGFSLDPTAKTGSHVILGCSHIYNARGEGLQYRLSKLEDPIIKQGNPYMSRDDARRTGENIRQLFFDARSKLPRRVVIHKRTPFLQVEREGLMGGLSGIQNVDLLEIQVDDALRYVASVQNPDGSLNEDNYPVRRGTTLKLDDYTALLWVHGATDALNPTLRYYQGKRRIPAPLVLRRHVGNTDLTQISSEVLGLSKMDWNSFDLYTKLPATLQSSGEIARIGSLLQPFGTSSYDYRLFI